jgi:hypothetical protein
VSIIFWWVLLIVLPVCAAAMTLISYGGSWLSNIFESLTGLDIDRTFVSVFFGLGLGTYLSWSMKKKAWNAKHIPKRYIERSLRFWDIRVQLGLFGLAGFLSTIYTPWIVGIVVGAVLVTYLPMDIDMG